MQVPTVAQQTRILDSCLHAAEREAQQMLISCEQGGCLSGAVV